MGPLEISRTYGPGSVIFLTNGELTALSGYKKPALQRRWLLENGYRFDVRKDGTPALLVAQVQMRQLKNLHAKVQVAEAPDFAALDD